MLYNLQLVGCISTRSSIILTPRLKTTSTCHSTNFSIMIKLMAHFHETPVHCHMVASASSGQAKHLMLSQGGSYTCPVLDRSFIVHREGNRPCLAFTYKNMARGAMSPRSSARILVFLRRYLPRSS
jgi:hypothetical protein